MLKIKWKYEDLPEHIKWDASFTGKIPLAVYSGKIDTIWLDWKILKHSPIVLIEAFLHEFVHRTIFVLLYSTKLMWILQNIWDRFDLKVTSPITIKLISKKLVKECNIRVNKE